MVGQRYELELGSPGPEQPRSRRFWDFADLRFFGLALVIIGVLPWLFLYGPVSLLANESAWPTVRSEVVTSRLSRYSSTPDTLPGRMLIVEFSYSVAGERHLNEQRIDMGYFSHNAENALARNRP